MKSHSGVAALQKMLENISRHLDKCQFYLTDNSSSRPICWLDKKSGSARIHCEPPVKTAAIMAERGAITNFGNFSSKLPEQLQAFLNNLKRKLNEVERAYGLKEDGNFTFSLLQGTNEQGFRENEIVQIDVRMTGTKANGAQVDEIVGKFNFSPRRNALTERNL